MSERKMTKKPVLYIDTSFEYNGKPKISDVDDLNEHDADSLEKELGEIIFSMKNEFVSTKKTYGEKLDLFISNIEEKYYISKNLSNKFKKNIIKEVYGIKN